MTDARPRYRYALPDGTIIRVIHDVGEEPRQVITFTERGGRVVEATLVSYKAVYS